MMTKEARKNIDPNRVHYGLNLDAKPRMIYHDNAEGYF